MSLKIDQKQKVVAEVADVAGRALSVIGADYRGLTVAAMTELRSKARDGGVHLRVVKNTLARRAFQGTDYKCLSDSLVGPLAFAFSMEDPGAGARLLKDFSKDHEKLEVKLIGISGQALAANELDRLATMPTREQALSMLMATIQAPITKLAQTLNEVPGKLVRTVEAVRQQKEAA
jgi:large subunit ribosomal protein L10